MACNRDIFTFTFTLYIVGRTPWTGDQPVVRPLPTHKTTQTQNKRTQTSMPWTGFEPTIRVFRVGEDGSCLLDRPATVIGTALHTGISNVIFIVIIPKNTCPVQFEGNDFSAATNSQSSMLPCWQEGFVIAWCFVRSFRGIRQYPEL
jgi:hypothetical protein